MKVLHTLPVLFAAFALAGSAQAQTTLIDVTFPDGTGTNPTFLEILNGPTAASGGNWTQATGVIHSGTNGNSTTACASDTTIDSIRTTTSSSARTASC